MEVSYSTHWQGAWQVK